MYIGIDQHTGLVYEGYGAPEIPSIPTPPIAQAKLIERDQDWAGLPSGLARTPMARLFRGAPLILSPAHAEEDARQNLRIVQPVRPASRWSSR